MEGTSYSSDWHQPKVVLTLVGMLVVAGIIALAILRDRIVNPPQWQVSVTGQGKVAYQADMANVTLGVQVDKVATAEAALRQLNDKATRLVAAVKAAGIAAEDIQTQNYSLFPQYDYRDGVQVPAGYSANQQVVVKVKGLGEGQDKVSKVIVAATSGGANQVAGITFEASNVNELKQQARLKAIADAKAKAGSLADAAGVRLGEVIGWWENVIQAPGVQGLGAYGGFGGAADKAASAMPPTIPTGTQEVILEVNLNYKVK